MSWQPPGFQPPGWQPEGWQPGDGAEEGAPAFDGPIPDIARVFDTGPQAYALGALYFSGAESFAISPAIEDGWSFNPTSAVLTVDSDDVGTFGPFTITATNEFGDTLSNAFAVTVVASQLAYVVDLDGLLPDDHAPRTLTLQTFEIPSGAFAQVRFSVVDADGVAAELGGAARFMVARKPGARLVVDTDDGPATAEIQPGGLFLATLADEVTDDLAGRYCWEAWVKDPTDRDVQIARGYVDVRASLRTVSVDPGTEPPAVVQLNTQYAIGALVRAQRDTGFYYRAENDGYTGSHYPDAWPRGAGEIVQIGSVIFTVVQPVAQS